MHDRSGVQGTTADDYVGDANVLQVGYDLQVLLLLPCSMPLALGSTIQAFRLSYSGCRGHYHKGYFLLALKTRHGLGEASFQTCSLAHSNPCDVIGISFQRWGSPLS